MVSLILLQFIEQHYIINYHKFILYYSALCCIILYILYCIEDCLFVSVLTALPLAPSSPVGPLAPGGPAAPGGPVSPFSPWSPFSP